MNLKKLFQSSIVALGLAGGTANAILIDDISDDFVIAFNQTQGTNQLSAFATFDVTAVNLLTGQIQIDVSISNTSVLTTFVNAGIISFGLETNPQVTGSYVATGAVFEGINNDSIPSLNINLCVFAANNCNGGAQNDLLAVGASDSFTILLTGTFPNGLDVLDSGIKFQTSGGSFEFTGPIIPCTSPTQPGCQTSGQVPEPASLLLLGLGLLGFALRRRLA